MGSVQQDSATLLAAAGLIDDGALALARAQSARLGGTVVEHLVLSKAVDDEEITELLRTRLLVERVPASALVGIPHEVIETIPRAMAVELRAVPIGVDDDGNLTVLFSDPANSQAAQEIAYYTGAYVVRAVATQLQLAWCLGHYYDFVSALGETLVQPAPAPERAEPRDTLQTPAAGEVLARRLSQMLPRRDTLLPAVMVADGVPASGQPTDIPEDDPDAPSTRRIQPLSVADLRAAARAADPRATQRWYQPAIERTSNDGHSPPHSPAMVDAPTTDHGERSKRNTALGVPSFEPASDANPAADKTRATDLPYTGAREVLSDPIDEEQRTVTVSSKRKRKKRSEEESGADMSTRRMPQSAMSSTVDDGWGSEDEIFGALLAGLGESTVIDEPALAAVPELTPEGAPANGKPARGKRTTTPPGADDTERLTNTVKELGHTEDRNAVFDLLMDYLSGTHNRVAFFAVKKGKVCAWKHKGLDGGDENAEVSLEDSATFHNVVQTQIPFHGGELDPAAADFVSKATGNPPEDVIAAPVAIGPRVIGVLFGDAPHGTLFDQQVAMVTRSAGLALQRILQASKK